MIGRSLTGFPWSQARKAVITLTDAFQGRSAQLSASQATQAWPVDPTLATSRSTPASTPERIAAPSQTHERGSRFSSKPRPAPAAAQTTSSPTSSLSDNSSSKSLLDMAMKEREDSNGKESAGKSLSDVAIKERKDVQGKDSSGKESAGESLLDMATKERKDVQGKDSNGKDSNGESLLDMAMKERKNVQVKDSNGKDSNGESLLDIARKEREDSKSEDSNGESLLDLAMKEREVQAAKLKQSPGKSPVGPRSATAGNSSKPPRKEGLLEEALRLRQQGIFTPRKASKAPVDSVRVSSACFSICTAHAANSSELYQKFTSEMMSRLQGQINASSAAILSDRPSSIRPTEEKSQSQKSGSEQASNSPLQSLKGGNEEVSPGDLSTGQAGFRPASSGPVLKEAASTTTQSGSSPLQNVKGAGKSAEPLIKTGPIDTGTGEAAVSLWPQGLLKSH